MTNPGQAVTMDEIEKEIKAASATPADPNSIKLEGDKVPEGVRGKTVAEILRERDVLAQSLEIANAARKAAEASVDAAKAGEGTRAPAAPPPPPAPEPKLTKEQLAELFEKDPVGAVAYMNDIAIKEASAHFERRFAPMAAGSANAGRESAKLKFSDEFQLFGKEIDSIVEAMPDKSIMSNPLAWDQLISFVRGKPGNLEKLFEAKAKKAGEAAAEEARRAQAAASGASLTSGVRAAPAAAEATPTNDTFGLDKAEIHAADVMDMSYAEYAKWKKLGG